MPAPNSLPTPPLWGPLLAAEYWLRPGAFLDRCEKLGDRFLLRLPGLPPLVCTTLPADVRAIFTGDQTALHLGEAVKKMAPHELVLGSSSITVKAGEAHLKDRRRLNPHFAGAGLKAYESGMAAATRQAMHAWPIRERVSFQRLMRRLRTMFQELRLRATTEPDEALARRSVTLVPGRGATVVLERRHNGR